MRYNLENSDGNGKTLKLFKDEILIIETPYYIGDKKMIKLYKLVGGEWKFVDYGVHAMADSYTAQGYIVVY